MIGRRVSVDLRAALVAGLATVSLVACSDDGGDAASFCERSAQASEFADTFGDGFDPTDTTGALEAFIEAREEEQALRNSAPEAIRADFDVLIDYLDQLIAGLESVDPDSTERPPIYDELRGRNDEISAASGRIEQYVRTNCTSTTS